ncbi:hypothetical protein FTX61_11430 [Nitriliruptoraceae bacterium ZYF776]|nr:hypothetical protein [Profundirhabdus halotolerans]
MSSVARHTERSGSTPSGARGDDGPTADVIPLRRGDRAAARAARAGHPAGRGAARRRDPRRSTPEDLARLLVRAAAEVTAGRRPLRQLEPLLAPGLTRRLGAELRRGRHRDAPTPRVRRVLVAPPTPSGAVEATVLVEREGRTTAVAVRLERHRGAWRATELTSPEAGYAPLVTASQADPSWRPRDAFDEVAEEELGELLSRRRGSA